MIEGWSFNPPPYWPKPPSSWTPPAGWQPDPAWGPVPPGWQLWVPARRPPRRRPMFALAGLAVLPALVAVAVTVPREAGPGADDLRVGGSITGLRPALTGAVPASTSSPEASPASDSDRPTPAVTPVRRPVTVRTYRNCAEMNRSYPNGVGMPDAVDRVTAGRRPVTNFGRSITIYRANIRHDRDGDGVTCEPAQSR
jgi:hypothetical protein